MMNDNTNTTPMHITMHEDDAQPQQTPLFDPNLLNFYTAKLYEQLYSHIERLVDTKFNQLVANTKALSLLDEQLREYITEVVDDKISDHNQEYDHDDFITADHVSDILASEVDTHIDHWVTHAQHDLVTESRLSELVRDAMSEEFDEMLESKLDNATISISL